mmetsp:Transcript_27493/g.64477  ORF Transcript_27493/g.64477 Transcript_27493/m.64477 type:complete len:89 (-) Transcript_27493:1305-1571(-)
MDDNQSYRFRKRKYHKQNLAMVTKMLEKALQIIPLRATKWRSHLSSISVDVTGTDRFLLKSDFEFACYFKHYMELCCQDHSKVGACGR